MFRLPQLMRWLATITLVCATAAPSGAQAPAPSGAPATGQAKPPAPKAPAAKTPAVKAPAAKTPAAKAPAAKAPAAKTQAAKAPAAKAPAAKTQAAKAPAAKAPAGKPKPAKAATKAPAKPAAKPPTTVAVAPSVHRRDPFAPLVNLGQSGPAIPAHLPPGKAGLMVSTLRVDGAVRAPNGMLAVVTNPQQRTYFLRQGDRLYDGTVEQISMDGVSFKEVAKDPFGKAIERVVTKRIYPIAGEQ